MSEEPSIEESSGQASSEQTASAAEGNHTLTTAVQLYDLGFNVFPQPYRQKMGLPWGQLHFARLPRKELDYLFRFPMNLAVMVGRTSQNLFVIDCESEAVFAWHLDQAYERGLSPWSVKTARGGHLYFLCADGEVRNVPSGEMSDAEVRGQRCYVLCPPSLHPSGVFYIWHSQPGDRPQAVAIDDIDWLVSSSGERVRLQAARRFKPSNPTAKETALSDPREAKLSKKTRGYLTTGHQVPQGNRNNLLFNAACDFSGCGYSLDEATRHLEPLASQSGLDAKEIKQTLASAFSQPRTPSRTEDVSGCAARPEDWRNAQAFVEQSSWPGRSGETNRRIMLALVERARLGGNAHGSFRASLREIGQLARISNRQTLSKRLSDLQEQGLIFKLAERDQQSGASLWHFSEKVLRAGHEWRKSEPLSSLPRGKYFSGSLLYHPNGLGTDATERGALGSAGLTVYWTLHEYPEEGGKFGSIVRRTRLSKARVRRALNFLRRFQIVENPKRGWWKVIVRDLSGADFDEGIAKNCGVFGKGQARAEKFALERQVRAAWLIVLRMRYLERRGARQKAPQLEGWETVTDLQPAGENASDAPERSEREVAHRSADKAEAQGALESTAKPATASPLRCSAAKPPTARVRRRTRCANPRISTRRARVT